MQASMHASMDASIHASMHAKMHALIQVWFMHTCMHVLSHAYTYEYTYIYIYYVYINGVQVPRALPASTDRCDPQGSTGLQWTTVCPWPLRPIAARAFSAPRFAPTQDLLNFKESERIEHARSAREILYIYIYVYIFVDMHTHAHMLSHFRLCLYENGTCIWYAFLYVSRYMLGTCWKSVWHVPARVQTCIQYVFGHDCVHFPCFCLQRIFFCPTKFWKPNDVYA